MENSYKTVFEIGNNRIECFSITTKDDLEKLKSNQSSTKLGKKLINCDIFFLQKNLDRISRTIKHAKTQEERQNMIDTYLMSKIINNIADKINIQKFETNSKGDIIELIKAGIRAFENINYSGAKVYTDFKAVDILRKILTHYKVELSIYLNVQDEEIIQGIVNILNKFDFEKVKIVFNGQRQSKFLELLYCYNTKNNNSSELQPLTQTL